MAAKGLLYVAVRRSARVHHSGHPYIMQHRLIWADFVEKVVVLALRVELLR